MQRLFLSDLIILIIYNKNLFTTSNGNKNYNIENYNLYETKIK